MLVVQQNWFRGLVHELHVVVIVSQVPVFVCKQFRKTVIISIEFSPVVPIFDLSKGSHDKSEGS